MYEYPFGNGQQLNLDWFLAEWKNLLAAWEAEKNGIAGALDAEIAKAEAALADVFAARDAAAQSAANALESKNAAAQSASDASGYLATVRADAQNAAQSESNAADSAQTALASKNAAGQSERNAAQSEANANSSKNAAAQSASDANESKSAAAQSASDADASKRAAAQSAEDAENAAASVEASAQQITTNANDISNLKKSINGKSIAFSNAEDTHREIGFLSNDYNSADSEIEIEIEVEENNGTNPNISMGVICRGEDNINANLTDNIGAGNIVLQNVTEGYKIYAKLSAVGNTVYVNIIGKNGSTKIVQESVRWFDKTNLRIQRVTLYTNNTPLKTSGVIKFKNGNYG